LMFWWLSTTWGCLPSSMVCDAHVASEGVPLPSSRDQLVEDTLCPNTPFQLNTTAITAEASCLCSNVELHSSTLYTWVTSLSLHYSQYASHFLSLYHMAVRMAYALSSTIRGHKRPNSGTVQKVRRQHSAIRQSSASSQNRCGLSWLPLEGSSAREFRRSRVLPPSSSTAPEFVRSWVFTDAVFGFTRPLTTKRLRALPLVNAVRCRTSLALPREHSLPLVGTLFHSWALSSTRGHSLPLVMSFLSEVLSGPLTRSLSSWDVGH